MLDIILHLCKYTSGEMSILQIVILLYQMQQCIVLYSVWATICKMVYPMLSDRCPVCLSVLSVTLVHCGQVWWIKMKLGMQVGLGPGHTVLDGDPALPPPKGHSPSNWFRTLLPVQLIKLLNRVTSLLSYAVFTGS